MSQTGRIIHTLKKMLKANGLTYRDVAAHLKMSEANVKRFFADESMSLERLEQISLLAGKEIADLVYQMDIEHRTLHELTYEQESELVNNKKLLLVAHLVINGWQFQDILDNYYFDNTELIQYLVKLDKLALIELLPLNRIKLRITPNFSWRRNGPVQQLFLQHLQDDFFNSDFTDEDGSLRVMAGMMTEKSAMVMSEKINDITLLFSELYRKDKLLPVEQRKNYGIVMAIRPWLAPMFNEIRK